jgi:hypothetical protein
VATLIGNVIVQSPQTRNRVLVSYGEEGSPWERNALRLAHNTLISEGWKPAWFLRAARELMAELEPVVALNNLVVGVGVFSLVNSGEFRGNWPATPGMLRDPDTLGFELLPDSWLRGRASICAKPTAVHCCRAPSSNGRWVSRKFPWTARAGHRVRISVEAGGLSVKASSSNQ